MEYRINKQALMDRLSVWDGYLRRKVSLIACGGTAMTLLNVKESTKDIDLLVPVESEYDYLIKTLEQVGYKSASGAGLSRGDAFIFEFFKGKKIHTTELLESPLDIDNHIIIKEFKFIYLGALNNYDLIISKIFRGTGVDVDDCLALFKAKKNDIDMKILEKRFHQTALFDVSEEKVNKNFLYFLNIIKKEGLYNGK